MFIIKWKKGLESLNINENSEEDNSDEESKSKENPPKIKITRALKK
jgi:hypothetical protein